MLAVGAQRFWMNGRPRVPRLQFRSAPMLAAAMAFAAGILCARNFHAPAMMAAEAASLLVLTLVALRHAERMAIVCALGFLIAVGCWSAQVEPPVERGAAVLPYADGLSRSVRGHVVRVRMLPAADVASAPKEAAAPWLAEPGAWEQAAGEARQSVDIETDAVEDVTPDTSTMQAARGGVRVAVIGGDVLVRCGDEVVVPLRMHPPDELRDQGAFSGADALSQEGVQVLASAKAASYVRTGGHRRDVRCSVYAAQTWAAAKLAAFPVSAANRALPQALRMDSDDAAMLDAMLFGERAGLTRTVKDSFERTGTFHLFVVSGIHVVLMAGGLLFLLRWLRVRDGVGVPVALAVTTAYALLTGFGAPVQRALLMTAAYMLARFFGRRASALQALGIAMMVTLVLDPRALYEAAFVMTSLVIFAIAGLFAPMRERMWSGYSQALQPPMRVESDVRFPPLIAAFRVRVRMWETVVRDLAVPRAEWLFAVLLRGMFALLDLMLMGAVAECVMALPQAVVFHRLTVWSLPVGVLLLPFVGMLLGCAVVFFVLLLLSPWAALPAAAMLGGAIHAMRAIVAHAGRMAGGDVRVPTPPVMALCIAGLLLVAACWALRERKRWVVWVGVAAVVVAPVLTLWPVKPLLHAGELEVTAIDVGQGDSLLVASPDGRTMLVDAGGPTGGMTANASWDVGEDVVAPYLWSRRLRRLDVVLLTHAHSDHMGGMPAVVRDFQPRELWMSIDPGDAPSLRALEDECAELGVRVRHLHAGEAVALGEVPVRVLAPEVSYANAAEPVNDDSLVTELRWGKASVLLEGDAEAPSERAMVSAGRVLPVTLLKVAHHGSRTSTTAPLLAAAQPRMAVVSVGRHNTFGHPRFEVLQALEAAHVQTFRTDRAGMTQFLLGSDGAITAEPVGIEH